MIERTDHFFGDAVDLLDPGTDTLVVIPMPQYQRMRASLDDRQIFERVQRYHDQRD